MTMRAATIPKAIATWRPRMPDSAGGAGAAGGPAVIEASRGQMLANKQALTGDYDGMALQSRENASANSFSTST
jgi:hypothetical protein